MTSKEAIERLQMILDGDMTLYMMNEKDARAVHHAIKAIEEVEEWKKLKLICANEGIFVYKQRGDV